MSTPLPVRPTSASATKTVPPRVLDAYGTLQDAFLYAPNWPERLSVLNAWLTAEHGCNTDHLALLLTILLEQLGDRYIDTIEAAMLYRVSLNTAQREAAMAFLTAWDGSDPKDVLRKYPAVGVFVMNRLDREFLGELS